MGHNVGNMCQLLEKYKPKPFSGVELRIVLPVKFVTLLL